MSQELITPQIGLAALLEVKEKILSHDPIYMRMGICTAFCDTEVMSENRYVLRDFLIQANIDWLYWPNYSGNPNYPVPYFKDDGTAVDPLTIYSLSSIYWNNTQYGNYRMELLNWLIEQFSNVVNEINLTKDNV